MRAKVVDVGALSAAFNTTSQGVLFVHADRQWAGGHRSVITDWLARRYRRQGLR
jgi:hypothetical protein